MRLYVPSTLAELDALTTAKITLSPRRAHAATPALVAELAAEGIDDLEEVEYVAQLAAADDSLVVIASGPSVPWLRVVISVDVPDAAVRPLPAGEDDDLAPSAVEITEQVTGVKIVCVHVDEPDAAADIEAVMGGDDDAIERLADRDLLWYDATEIAAIPR
ncbi:hypothetical protein SAMN05216410_3521 [Sanguibacter gelidistatuariae]|uniref:Uncharacterized protein n=1 Tax=Sanguibacter gelidistatuariae TaxID=1814289 RepID=A0A1G6VS41_9MICO|nr:hypothetical protein [Sanguibacter gelidistatuariae]SDD56364.1 hypothetical protein SAMN05216410_3521 [Sanguibacter gelidistatuariae]